MKIATIDNFLTKGSGQIPDGKWTAVAIHCSSEVESFQVGGARVGVRSVLPLPGTGGQELKSCRSTIRSGVALQEFASGAGPLNGDRQPGEKLTLQLYEACDDAAQPPGPRVPFTSSIIVKAAQVGATAGAATLLAALPMSGRLRAALYFTGGGLASNLSVGLRGIRCDILNVKGFWAKDSPAQTVLFTNPLLFGAAAGLTQDGMIYVDNESFDYLLVFAYAATPSDFAFFAEVTGERL